ncbi:uncharacterized protein TRIADDRAFT_60595 [Trichoplax adhaerens]|uniref:Uncharacterized protein n=1 Tax=Trichoplax adhaerens TaxID=10228 RepID=B3S8M8_TRIAD|nr:hypothetical protein TRIADDRAFT_60595 [Trichoplax adhaerens]EDV20981.1 hypothetical protein TRIADDRAFT_60595 [Trichoplax adhaerens]|eukprot:XP_002116625.1 hypothetical protein TRIADDRAFT_60595 [Trichoplax adhaerens]
MRRRSVCKEEERLKSLCQYWEGVAHEENVPDEALGRIRAAIGKSGLLLNKKFQQFRKLCGTSDDVENGRETKVSDLQGFWDMVLIQVDSVTEAFKSLQLCKDNDWAENDDCKNVVKTSSSSKRKVMLRQSAVEKQATEPPQPSPQAEEKARVRELFRKQLQEMKKEGRKRVPKRMSDSIEIYAPDVMIIESPSNYK